MWQKLLKTAVSPFLRREFSGESGWSTAYLRASPEPIWNGNLRSVKIALESLLRHVIDC
jgi:hypothetical protein